MAAKKPAAKATKAKKTVVKKAPAVKKAAPAKKPAAVAAGRSSKAAAAPKPVAKPAAKPAAPVKAPTGAAKAAPAAATAPAPKPVTEPRPRDPMLARPAATRLAEAASNNDEDGEAQESVSSSLLAGPRNVKPYIARRGEQYMNKEQVVNRGWELEVEFKHTWSCYKGEDLHCGTCPTCRSRKDAFIVNGLQNQDVEYAA